MSEHHNICSKGGFQMLVIVQCYIKCVWSIVKSTHLVCSCTHGHCNKQLWQIEGEKLQPLTGRSVDLVSGFLQAQYLTPKSSS